MHLLWWFWYIRTYGYLIIDIPEQISLLVYYLLIVRAICYCIICFEKYKVFAVHLDNYKPTPEQCSVVHEVSTCLNNNSGKHPLAMHSTVMSNVMN